MHLLFDISAHGFGHLAQCAPVIESLAHSHPKLDITIRSRLPLAQLKRRIKIDFNHIAESRDFGFVMKNAVDIDLALTAKQYQEFHQNWDQRVEEEAHWQKKHKVDILVSNIAYLSLAAASRIDIPSIAMGSLNWADLLKPIFSSENWFNTIEKDIISAYQSAPIFLCLEPGLPMERYLNRYSIGPIAQVGSRCREDIAKLLKLPSTNRWVLVTMGGMAFDLPIDSWPSIEGISWIVPNDKKYSRPDIAFFDDTTLHFPDLLASVDAVITKSGYGTFVESACSATPILYLERPDWLENQYLSAWLQNNARSQPLTRLNLSKGHFTHQLNQLWQAPIPQPPLPLGVGQAVEKIAYFIR